MRDKKKRALVVEDEAIVRTFITNVFEMMDYEVEEADNEEEAWIKFCARESDLSLIYTDYCLFSGNGLDLYERIRERNPDISVVIASGFFNKNYDAIYQDQKVCFMNKPLDINEIMQVINKLNPDYC
ncbi:MAG: response regulator [bacterium]|jgi:DNA-binding NtrC family response regulator